MQNITEQINDIEKNVARGDMSPEEIQVYQFHILRSIHQEIESQDHHSQKRDEKISETLNDILEIIKPREDRIKSIEKTVQYHTYVIALIVFLTAPIALWAIPKILDQIFS